MANLLVYPMYQSITNKNDNARQVMQNGKWVTVYLSAYKLEMFIKENKTPPKMMFVKFKAKSTPASLGNLKSSRSFDNYLCAS